MFDNNYWHTHLEITRVLMGASRITDYEDQMPTKCGLAGLPPILCKRLREVRDGGMVKVPQALVRGCP